jgi:surface protein
MFWSVFTTYFFKQALFDNMLTIYNTFDLITNRDYIMKGLLLLFLYFLAQLSFGQANPDFYLAPNGVTCLCPEADFGDTGSLTLLGEEKVFTKRTKNELRAMVISNTNDPQISLTCTSGITDMSDLFSSLDIDISTFNQKLEHWDVSQVTDMSYMFSLTTSFNQSLNNWDVSRVTNMEGLFYGANNFNKPLNNWDVSQVTTMNAMFYTAGSFNQPLNSWDVSNVTDMYVMFYGADSFNQPLNSWNLSKVTNMGVMFYGAESFDQPLNSWDVSNVNRMDYMFDRAASFNQPLNDWDVSRVTNMDYMFRKATVFNQDLTSWCVELLPDEPNEFAVQSALQTDFFPNWGDECENLSTNFNPIGADIQIYPNPSSSSVFIDNKTGIEIVEIKLIDMRGRIIQIISLDRIKDGLNLSSLDAGIYIVQLTTQNKNKIIKKLLVN